MVEASSVPSPAERARRLAAAERPRRVKLSMAVMLELAPGCTVKAKVDDVSKDGFRLRSRVLLHEAQKIRIRMPREVIRCEVRWVDGFAAGGVFDEPPRACSW